MKTDYISSHGLLTIGIVSAVTGAIYANNLQAELLAQYVDECPAISCAQPPAGCTYVPPYTTDVHGCQVGCGELSCQESYCGDGVCDENEQHILCVDPPFPCDEQCMKKGNFGCFPVCKEDCKKLYCLYNGREYTSGMKFDADDGCNTCFCEDDGSVSCTEKACFDDGKSFCTDAAGNVYRPGESFTAPDGCNTCHCGENGVAACTKMFCRPPEPEPVYTDGFCFGDTDCNEGDICSVAYGDCMSACRDGSAYCMDVCAGFCMPQAFGNPYELPQCSTTAQCAPNAFCTAEFAKDCFEQCPLSNELCSVICGGKCISFDMSGMSATSQSSIDSHNDYDYEYEDEVRTVPVQSRFSDTGLDTLEGVAANKLAALGVIGGFSDGTFRGGQPVNRAEAAKFLLLSRLGGVAEARNNKRFLDVLEGEWYVKYVINAAQLGIINGYPDQTFRPANTVNTAEFLKMLSITFSLTEDIAHTYADVPAGAWYERYAGAVQMYDIFPGRPDGKLMPEKFLTRGEVAIAIYTLLQNQ